MVMTKRKNCKLRQLGQIIYGYRRALSLPMESRKFFLDDRVGKGLLREGDISEKTLTNIENGYNLPSLTTLKLLSIALEVEFADLVMDIYDFIPSSDK